MPAQRVASVRRRRLGEALRQLRETSGLSAEMVARRLSWSASKVSRIETARISVRSSDVRRLLKLYRADERLTEGLLALAAEAAARGWWEDFPEIHQTDLSVFIAMEDEAESAAYFQSDVVPGLLQTEDYARELILGWGEIVPLPPKTLSLRLQVRLRRQRLLQPPRCLPLSVVLDESVLLRRIGSPSTMARQLDRLVELAALPNVTLRVLPLDGNHGASIGSFTLLEFSSAYDVAFPPLVHIESATATHAQDEATTHEYRLAHQWLVDHSLTPEDSTKRISAIIDQWSTTKNNRTHPGKSP